MISIKKNRCIELLCLTMLMTISMSCRAAASSSEAPPSADMSSTQTILIFLDDSETDEIGSITGNFLTAFMQEAAPILVSASIIDTLKKPKPLEEKNPEVLRQIAKKISNKKFNELTPEDNETFRSIILSIIDVDKLMEEAWIIKEVNPSLYLLLPKKFLKNKGSDLLEIKAYMPHLSQDTFTQAEKTLGLKVNHLKTVALSDIQKPESPNYYVEYLTPFLDTIFLTRNDYLKNIDEPYSPGPQWVIYINGHGYTESMFVGMTTKDFKKLLEFLEHIHTKLFIYNTCYSGGKNIEIMYKDAMTGIDKTYDFAIIILALTDSYSYAPTIKVKMNQGKLAAESTFDYNCFVQHAQTDDIINYEKALSCITDEIGRDLPVNATPQIRFPGLPWFSVLDMQLVAPIGSVIAKTRTAPLNIATFFAKKGIPARPEGILLYTYDIPFELIINTKKSKKIDKQTGQQRPESCYVPTFVSMIPKNAVHHLKKISSDCNTCDMILNSFYIEGLFWKKTFIIDEVTASFSSATSSLLSNGSEAGGTLTDVIVELTEEYSEKYFSYNGQVYFTEGNIKKNPFVLANDEQKSKYQELLAEYRSNNLAGAQTSMPEVVITHELIQQEKEHALLTFNEALDPDKAEQEIIRILDKMPNNTALQIPKIREVDCPLDNPSCWDDFFNNLTKYRPRNNHKILLFDEVERTIGDTYAYTLYKDFIIEITPGETRVFYKLNSPDDPYPTKISRRISESKDPNYIYLTEDYAPTYVDLLAYFDKHLTLEKPKEILEEEKQSIRKQLTPERVAGLKAMLERKYSKQ